MNYFRTALFGLTLGLLVSVPDDALAGPGTVQWVYDLNRATVDVPAEMARDAVAIWYGCEVRTEIMTPYGEPQHALNRQSGAMGTVQLMGLHRPGMERLGLSYDQDRDRIIYAGLMWARSGFAPWDCWKGER